MVFHAVIIYGEASGIVRRVVLTDERDTLPGHVGRCERMVAAPAGLFESDAEGNSVPIPERLVAHVARVRKRPAESGRCLVIHHGTGDVVDVIMADPLLDRIDGHTLHQDETGVPGSVPDESGKFQPPRVG